MIGGTTNLHKELERKLASFKCCEDIVLFPTGHAANLGAISAICNHRDFILVDKLVHYSIIEGIKLSGAKLSSFRHSSTEHLEKKLKEIRENGHKGGILVVVEGVYGIDGDVAPLDRILEVCHKYNARLMVDDAHATGVVGRTGRGSAEACGVNGRVDYIVMDSLSKALGSMGGFIGGPKHLTDYLRYYSKPVSFSVGLPAVNVAPAITAIDYIAENPQIVKSVQEKISYFKENLINLGLDNVSKSGSAIMSFVIGDEKILRKANKFLFTNGLWAEELPFPAVPKGEERIRLRINNGHSSEQLNKAISLIERLLAKFPEIPRIKKKYFSYSTENRNDKSPKDGFKIISDEQTLREAILFRWKNDAKEKPGIPWYSVQDRIRLLNKKFLYIKNHVNHEVYTIRKDGKIIATASIFVDKNFIKETGQAAGFLGHLSLVPGYESSAGIIIDNAIGFCKKYSIKSMWAPIDYPMFLFGGGVLTGEVPEEIPFFMPYYPVRYKDFLEGYGFKNSRNFTHFEIPLKNNTKAEEFKNEKVIIRGINKLKWDTEANIILGILNKTFPTLGHYASFTKHEWLDLIADFRDFALSDLWLIVEVDGKSAGFVVGFPNCGKFFLESGGEVGTVDLANFQKSYENAKSGQIAWLAVDPQFKNYGIGKILLAMICKNMQKRGFRKTYLTWEIVTGEESPEELVLSGGGRKADFQTEILKLDI